MDDIIIDENYDEIKEDFFKGLTRRQTLYGALTIIGGAALFYLFLIVLALPQTIALYLAIVFVIPIAASGFVQIYDMTIVDFIKMYIRTKNSQGLVYISEEDPDLEDLVVLQLEEKYQKKNRIMQKPVFLYVDKNGNLCEISADKEGDVL